MLGLSSVQCQAVSLQQEYQPPLVYGFYSPEQKVPNSSIRTVNLWIYQDST